MYKINSDGTVRLQPYDKFEDQGAASLSDEELLAVIIRTGADGEDALTVACHVLRLCGEEKGLLALYHMQPKELMKIRGIGEVKAVRLLAVAELARRIANSSLNRDICLRNPLAVAGAYRERMRHLEKEQLMAVFLDASDSRIGDEVISEGTLSSTLISSREIFRTALKMNAASVIVIHNHPSGDPYPSDHDVEATRHLKEASRYMEIPLLDHIIIGDNKYFSFKEKGDL